MFHITIDTYLLLLSDAQSRVQHSRSDGLVDVFDGLQDALAVPVGLDVVAQFQGLMDTGRRTGWNGGTEQAQVGHQIDLDGWVTARVEDLTGLNTLEWHFGSGIGGTGKSASENKSTADWMDCD